ncbi:transcriptional regulator [Bordetella trematum]|uniref:AsnC family transcriptional regulator n=1 Tax=Bordetella trematum TaxID=123899 RepID=A0A157SF96_9BORD|nr:Lrp/AsnC family transcriptional regulator [Bordetella trematum]AUL45960.1 transcriptional regulator [Bordetella trematum]AZR92704.1 transcriptional regulator [Bordetella trematum]NNH18096.1 Lrp/AsnC family transcriptional regulator [Bordetella trematum]QIM71308.1 Lrp/AsnC family transcriptional regulator [Bordetella trematum]SAI29290.1 AsnC family transcriptional regulator [Bordetella trematum]
MDKKDRSILALLQADARLSNHEIAEQVHLSPTACWKRIQQMQQSGLIRRQVCLLDSAKAGLGLTVFVSIKTSHHDLQWLKKFSVGVRDIPEVVEFYRMTGDTDYLLKVLVPDIAGFDRIYKKLIQIAELFDVSSSFAMEEIKYTTALPLDYL